MRALLKYRYKKKYLYGRVNLPALPDAVLYDTAAAFESRNRDYPHEERLAFENRAQRSGAFGEKHSGMKYVRHASEKFQSGFKRPVPVIGLPPPPPPPVVYTFLI
jgi:hypothetical protein